MTYFPDLSPFSYSRPASGYPIVRNIGWLDAAYPYTKGSTDPEFRERLLKLCGQPRNLCFGFHMCPFCDGSHMISVWDGKRRIDLGNGEIWVEGAKAVYVAPTLVYHYVVEHDYRPPDPFVEAVRTAPLTPLEDKPDRQQRLVRSTEAGIQGLPLDPEALQALTQEVRSGRTLTLHELARILMGTGPAMSQETLALLVSHTENSRPYGRLMELDGELEGLEYGLILSLNDLAILAQVLLDEVDPQDLAWLWQDLREGNWLIAPPDN